MPCYDPRDKVDLTRLDNLMAEAEHARDIAGECISRLERRTDMLCRVMKRWEEEYDPFPGAPDTERLGLDPDIFNWWQEHKKLDKERTNDQSKT